MTARSDAPEIAPGRQSGPVAGWTGGPRLLTPLVSVLVGVVTVLWLLASPWAGRTTSGAQWLGTFSAFAGIVGTVLYAVTIVLSARFRMVESFVGGLDKVYRQHHLFGSAAFALLLAHPAFLAWKHAQISMERAARTFHPTTRWPLLAGQIALYLMVPALVATIYLPIRHQTLVNLQRLLGLLFLPGAYHALFTGGDSYRDAPLRIALGIICALAIAALVKHSLMGRTLDHHQAFEVESVTQVGEHMAEVRLRPAGGASALAFVPGQFAYLRLSDATVSAEPHPFSIASAPGDAQLRFVVNEVGDWTNGIESVAPGTAAVVEGPYGRFSHRFVKGRSQLWIAGGVGITPFLSMAASLAPQGCPYDVDLVWTYPSPQRAPFLEELAALESERPHLRIHPRCDLELPFLTAADLTELCDASGGAPLKDREVLFCGPAAMRDALVPKLVAAGVHPSQIHDEVFRYA